jgi:hypothetical protein
MSVEAPKQIRVWMAASAGRGIAADPGYCFKGKGIDIKGL